MDTEHFLVFCDDERWVVQFKGRNYPFGSHQDALTAATKMAETSCNIGRNATVRVPGSDGNWYDTWSYDEARHVIETA